MRKSSMEGFATDAIFMKEHTTKKNKCFYCRKSCEGWICKKCDKDRNNGKLDTKSSSTLVIYNTI